LKKEELFNLIGGIDEGKVNNVTKYVSFENQANYNESEKIEEGGIMNKMKKMTIFKYGTAVACICLLVVGISYMNNKSSIDSGFGTKVDGTVPGGEIEGDIDPTVASLIVAPENENEKDVEDANMNGILEEKEAQTIKGLGKHLPSFIPNGYSFDYGAIYETTMKNGTKYYRLVVNYSFVEENNPDMMFEEEVDVHDYYSIAVMNYKPRESFTYYTVDTLPKSISGIGTIHLKIDDVYVDVETGDLSYDDIVAIVSSIK